MAEDGKGGRKAKAKPIVKPTASITLERAANIDAASVLPTEMIFLEENRKRQKRTHVPIPDRGRNDEKCCD